MLKLKLSKNKRQVYFFYFSRKPYLLYEKNGLESELIRSEFSGGQNDDFRPLTSTLGGRGMGCRDKYVTS
jgi:hypothetical protein